MTDESALLDAPAVRDDVERAEADPPAATPGGIDLRFRPDIEGLRAVAILLVVLYHCGISWMPGGFVGVDVFFVISGFLITGILLRETERRGRISISGFYARRSRRILPAAMLVVIVTVLMAHHFQSEVDFDNTAIAGKWASIFAANIHFANINTNYFQMSQAPSPFLTYWSLAVEEQFYIVWPIVVLGVGFLTTALLRRVPVRVSVLVVATIVTVSSFLWAVHANGLNATWAYFSPFTRGWELGVGAMTAAIVAMVPWRALVEAPGRRAALLRWGGVVAAFGGIAMILVSATDYTIAQSSGVNPTFPPSKALIPVLGAVLVVLGGATGLGAGWLLGCTPARGTGLASAAWVQMQRCNPMRLIGRVSYGWYLLHWPPMILWIGVYYQGVLLPVHERLLIAVITLGISFVMYYVLEKPIRRSRYLASRPWVSIAMGLSLVTAAFCVSELYHKGLFG